MAGGPNEDPVSRTATNTQLLDGLRNPENHEVWRQFVDRYRPLIVGYARRSFGFEQSDAEDAAQTAMGDFADAYRKGGYRRTSGRLRNWLFGIATNRLKNFARNRARVREVQLVGESDATALIDRIPDDVQLEEVWEDEWRQAMIRQCMVEVRFQFDARTLQAFELYVLEGLAAGEVAKMLDTTANAVYLAKHHILKRIRELLPRMEEIW